VTVLVTGSSGHLGEALVRTLQAQRREVIGTDTRTELGWQPRHDFRSLVARLKAGDDIRSPLARAIGSKGYHDRAFSDGPYPVE
jgi:UDP-glucose 4-epimerase